MLHTSATKLYTFFLTFFNFNIAIHNATERWAITTG